MTPYDLGADASMDVLDTGQVQARSIEADFVHLLKAHEQALVRLARRYADGEDWRDLLQEMRLQLWRAFPSFDGRSAPGTWIYRVALNTALSHVRKPRREHVSMDAVAEPGDTGDAQDVMQVLDAFLATLDPIPRAVLLLDLEGMNHQQIGEITGLSPNAVAVRMTRMRQAFEHEFIGEPQ